jgi:hypothetical protein
MCLVDCLVGYIVTMHRESAYDNYYLAIEALIEGAEKLVRDYGCTAIAVVVSTLRVVL